MQSGAAADKSKAKNSIYKIYKKTIKKQERKQKRNVCHKPPQNGAKLHAKMHRLALLPKDGMKRRSDLTCMAIEIAMLYNISL